MVLCAVQHGRGPNHKAGGFYWWLPGATVAHQVALRPSMGDDVLRHGCAHHFLVELRDVWPIKGCHSQS